jgi:hypothetical protein
MAVEDEDVVLSTHLKFAGGRFEGEGVHLDGLGELVRYQRIVIEFAKDLWLEEQGEAMPSRIQRQFQLRMTEHVDHSYEATVVRNEQMELSPEVERVAELTQERIDKMFDRITRGLTPDIQMSQESVIAVKKFGISFRLSEGLIVHPDSDRERRYDARSRAWLRGVLKADTMEVDGPLIGRVFALDTNAKTFKFEMPDATDIAGSYLDGGKWEDFANLIDLPDSRTLIRLSCKYTAALSGVPVSIQNVADIEVFSHDDDAWTDTLIRLASLRPGWYSPHVGDRIEVAAIEMARDILRSLQEGETKPQAFPTIEGGVQIEWLNSAEHIEIEISPDILIEAHYFNARTKSSIDEKPVGVEGVRAFLRTVRTGAVMD